MGLVPGVGNSGGSLAEVLEAKPPTLLTPSINLVGAVSPPSFVEKGAKGPG